MKYLLASLILIGNATFAADDIMVPENSAWVRATPPGVTTTAIYLTVLNHSDSDISLVSAASDISPRIELHTHKQEDGVMKMQQVESIAIAAGEQTNLKPHAEHIMVFNLEKSLEPGDQITVELAFDNGKTQTIEVPVMKDSPNADAKHVNHKEHGTHKK